MKKIIFGSLAGLFLLISCHSKTVDFPDYKYTTVYFATQTPVRTIILGTDYVYDNSLDTAHQCLIEATMGGVYSNTTDRTLDVVVDNSLCNNLTFSAGGSPVLAMPSSYYTLPADMKIVIPSGSMMGGIKVQLTDAFFADPLSVKNTYVIPLRITKVTNADSVLSGIATVANPNRLIAADWSTAPKDYILYAVKYKNPWDAVYLRRGIETSTDTTVVYHQQYVEYDQVVTTAATQSLNQLSLSLNGTTKGNVSLPFQALLNFGQGGNCTLTNPAGATYSITGNGSYVKNGDSWGNQQRDVLYLKYQVTFGSVTHSMADTLVLRDRAESYQTFSPFYNN
jgi:hypothetical protein